MGLSLAKAERALNNLVLISFLVPFVCTYYTPKVCEIINGLYWVVVYGDGLRQSGVNCHYFGFGDIYFETSLFCISVENSCFLL